MLKTTVDPSWGVQVLRAAKAVEIVRRHGYPTPRWVAAGAVPTGGAYHLEEFIDGETVERIYLQRAEALIELIERQRDLDPDPGRCWTDMLRAAPGALDAAVIAAVGDAAQGLVERCERMREGADAAVWPRTDMVHGDLRPANVLFVGATMSGVVDIEAIGSGPRAFDYATLLSHEALDPAAVALLAAAGAASADPRVLRACVAHVVLDLVRFVAKSGAAPAVVRRVIEGLEERAEAVERLVQA